LSLQQERNTFAVLLIRYADAWLMPPALSLYALHEAIRQILRVLGPTAVDSLLRHDGA
jgi:hypothetical protein